MSNLAYVLFPSSVTREMTEAGIFLLQPQGVEKILPLGTLSPEEESLVKEALPELKKNIEKGKQFVKGA